MSEDGSRGFFIELKTDVNSRRRSQDDYLTEALDKTMCNILYDYREISKSKNDKHARQKYFHMSHALSELGLFKLEDDLEDTIYADHSGGVYDLIDAIEILASPTLEVVYVQPRKSKDDKRDDKRFHYIYFKEFADCVIRAIWAACSRAICENGKMTPPIIHLARLKTVAVED